MTALLKVNSYKELGNSLYSKYKKTSSSLLTTNNSSRGFTLIELMITISIIAIISAVGLTSYSQAQKIARDAKRKQDLRSIAITLELFYQINKRYPCSGNWLSSASGNDWLKDVPTSDPLCTGGGASLAPNYINSIPKDPLNTSPYIYRIWTEGWNACSNHQGYMLVTDLENSADKDTITNTPTDVCGTNAPQGEWGPGFPSANSFIVSQRK